MSIRNYVVGYTPGQLDLLETVVTERCNLTHRPTRVLLLDPSDVTERKFRGVRTATVFMADNCTTWRAPSHLERPGYVYFSVEV